MRIEEIRHRIKDLEEQIKTNQELLEFWQSKLQITLQAETVEQNFDSYRLINLFNDLVSSFYDKPLDIRNKSREKELVYGRAFYCWYVKYYYKISLQGIGDTINRNHATVIHAIKTHEDLTQTEEYEYLKLTQHIQKYLK